MNKQIPYYLTLIFILTLSGTVSAQNKVVVIPFFSDAGPKPMKNIITVSEKNGDFTQVEDALDSITDASASNRYLILIGPGDYLVKRPLKLNNYVQISGSGRNVTKLLSRITTSSPTDDMAFMSDSGSYNDITGAPAITERDEIVITDLTIENQFGSENNRTAIASIQNTGPGVGAVVFRDTNLFVAGSGSKLYGFRLGDGATNGSKLEMDNSALSISCFTCSESIGVEMLASTRLTMRNGSSITSFLAGTGTTNIGIFQAAGELIMNDSSILVGGDKSIAIEGGDGGTDFPGLKSRIKRSTIDATRLVPVVGEPGRSTVGPGTAISFAVDDPSGTLTITQSSIRGSITDTSGDDLIRCNASDDNDGRMLDVSCQPEL